MGRGMGTNPVSSGRGKETAPYQRLLRSGQGFIRNAETGRSKAERSEVVRSQAGRSQGSGGGMNPRQPSEVDALQIESSRSTPPKRTGCSPCSSSIVSCCQSITDRCLGQARTLSVSGPPATVPAQRLFAVHHVQEIFTADRGPETSTPEWEHLSIQELYTELLQKKETGICGNLLISLVSLNSASWINL